MTWFCNTTCKNQHIEDETQWFPFSRRHFQMNFPGKTISLECVPLFLVDNVSGLVLTMTKPWSDDKPWLESTMTYWRIYAPLGVGELKANEMECVRMDDTWWEFASHKVAINTKRGKLNHRAAKHTDTLSASPKVWLRDDDMTWKRLQHYWPFVRESTRDHQ